MQLPGAPVRRWGSLGALLTSLLLVQPATAAPATSHSDNEASKHGHNSPFAILDPQNWVNPDNMTWDDWRAPPGTNWVDPSRKGSSRNFNIALVTVDYPNQPFVVTLPPKSTIFGNPQPSGANIKREDVPSFYRNLLNKPGKINHEHTLHEYWMEDSNGVFGVDLTAFGVYEMPADSYQYGIDDRMNEGACPAGKTCGKEIRDDALAAWRADIGDEEADSFELVFILSAGQDESSTWQEFGEMRFENKEDVPKEFGPPGDGTDFANTRYVNWTSWAAASTIWPNAGGGSSTQGESSGMGVYAHELSHLLNISDNYNNPFGDPPRRAYTGPWSMLSRGSFNGPGGPHSRWQIPPQQGAAMGSLHTLRDKVQLGLIEKDGYLNLSRDALADSGIVVARLTARAVAPGKGKLMGIRIHMDADNSPECDTESDPLCDGGNYNTYDMEVIDRMGADSFTPDSGVMISKSKTEDKQPFQWTIDANPDDIELVDFRRPDGTPVMITIGDYRQLADALFHAGTRSGSQYEYVDEANKLHFYIIDVHRDRKGVLSYTTAVRSLEKSEACTFNAGKVNVAKGMVASSRKNSPTKGGVTCTFELQSPDTNSAGSKGHKHPQDVSAYLNSDVYRLEATTEDRGWKVQLPNALVAVEAGKSSMVKVAVAADRFASRSGTVKLVATSESNPSITGSGKCVVKKH